MRQQLIVVLGLMLGACTPDEQPAAPDAGAQQAVEAPAAKGANGEAAATPITEIAPAVEVLAQNVAYGTTPDRNLEGYLVVPSDVLRPVPGVIMIHESWGLNDTIKAMARRLAGEGYAVLAVDLFGGQTAATRAEAERLMSERTKDGAAVLDNLEQAYDHLDESVLAPRIATLGWSMGGGWSLEAALALGDKLDAVVMFYGQVVNDDARLASLKSPLLGHFGQLDKSIPVSDVQQFRRRLRDLGKDAEVLIYPNVDEAFANPSGATYNQKAATDAWAATVQFLDARLH